MKSMLTVLELEAQLADRGVTDITGKCKGGVWRFRCSTLRRRYSVSAHSMLAALAKLCDTVGVSS